MNNKTCSRCKKILPSTTKHFRKATRNKDGLAYECKECKKNIDKKWREDNEEKFKASQKTPSFVWSQIKYQAKKRGYTLSISEVYYHTKLANSSCYYCGEKDTKYWIDRKINNKGYTIENTVPCCEMCNKSKRHIDPDIWINHCKKIANYNK